MATPKPVRSAAAELEDCLNHLAGPDGRPKSAKRPSTGSAGGFRFSEPAFNKRAFDRLTEWLNELTSQKRPDAYAALLQFYMEQNGITWPEGVFKHEPGAKPKGRPQAPLSKGCKVTLLRELGQVPSSLGEAAAALKAQGWNQVKIAKTLIGKCDAKAQEQVRKAAQNYRPELADNAQNIAAHMLGMTLHEEDPL